MKNKIITILILSVVVIFTGTNNLLAMPKTPATKKQAEVFMKKGQYPQAIAILEEVTSKIADADAEFKLGNCYAIMGSLDFAEQKYKNAIILNPKYGNLIGDQFSKAGWIALNNNLPQNAEQCFRKAIEYQPNLRSKISEKLYQDGEALLLAGMFGYEDNKFKIAASLSPVIRNRIANLYIAIAEKLSDEKCVYFYEKAGRYYNGYSEKIGNRLMVIAKRFAKLEGKDKETEYYKKIASLFIGPKAVEELLPEMINYPVEAAPLNFKLKAGEQTDHYIHFSGPPDLEIGFASNKGSKYKMLFNNGDVCYKNKRCDTSGPFKLIAITDCEIELKIK